MKIATWNVNGIRARETQLCDWLARDSPDVVCLQELKAEPAQIPERCNLAEYTTYWHGHKGYSGVSLHVKNDAFDAGPTFSHPEFDMETRIVQARIGNLVLASVYVPNGGKDYAAKLAFLERLVTWTRSVHEQGLQLVLCGDINIAHTDIDVHPRERKAGVIGQRSEERALLDAMLERLVDVQRQVHPDNDRMFTWWAPWRNLRQRNIGWRIDYVLASRTIAQRVTSCEVLSEIGTSDHAPVLMQVADSDPTSH
ncbi:MAG TPA: exodeoxyribonuclease III [Casimicrobiaceae bacterium]|nr:exodeoxyribonuclease III [Casimicrobiaceae bacterium]